MAMMNIHVLGKRSQEPTLKLPAGFAWNRGKSSPTSTSRMMAPHVAHDEKARLDFEGRRPKSFQDVHQGGTLERM